MKRRLRPEIVSDLTEAAQWYEKRRAGLAEQFLDAVESTQTRIEENPRFFIKIHGDLRRALLPRPFPFQIFFRRHEDLVEVYAVLHTSRDSQEWLRRV